MRILDFNAEPLAFVPFLNAGRSAGSFYRDELPIHVAWVDRLPVGTDAIIATADLQGREMMGPRPASPPRLLGEVLPKMLADELLPNLAPTLGEINPLKVGVLLAGDFYTVPALDRRGGSGDVTSVWQAFADEFQWVTGIAGNHDLFEDKEKPPRLPPRSHFIDEKTVRIDHLKIGGLSGIIGSPGRPQRRSEEGYLAALSGLLDQSPDVLVSHDGPEGIDRSQRGSPTVRELLESFPVSLLVRGHAHWDDPFCTLPGGTQVLNVDARVAILVKKVE